MPTKRARSGRATSAAAASARCCDRATERFGPFTFTLGLARDGGDLLYPVERGRLLALPLPSALIPVSETRESADAGGRFAFDVRISLPRGGRVAHYRGWLVREPDDQP